MKRFAPGFVLAVPILGVALSACSSVTVRRVTEDNRDSVEGFRYALPHPFLLVTPQKDGTLAVETVHLADRSQEYAVAVTNVMAAHTFEMKVLHGLLEEVKWNGDSAAVVAEGVKAAGELAKTQLETEKAVAEEQAEAAKKKAEGIAALNAELAKAKLELQQAQAEFDFWDSGAGKDAPDAATKKLAAALALEKAKAKVKALNLQLGKIEAASMQADGAPAGVHTPSALEREAGFQVSNRYGPVLLRIVESANGQYLDLVPVQFGDKTQEHFESYDAPKPPKKAAEPLVMKLDKGPYSPEATVVATFEKEIGGQAVATLHFQLEGPISVEAKIENSKHVKFELPKNLSVNRTYRLRISLTADGVPTYGEAPIAVE